MISKITTVTALLAFTALSSSAHAANHSITAGYAQAKVHDFKNINGVNLKYRYEWNSPVSVITSFSFMNGAENDSHMTANDSIENKARMKHYSLAIGPAWRFNNYVSVYGMLGVGYSEVNYQHNWKSYTATHYRDRETINIVNNSVFTMYSAGVQINLLTDLVIDIAYQGSQLEDGTRNRSINGFNLGFGYWF